MNLSPPVKKYNQVANAVSAPPTNAKGKPLHPIILIPNKIKTITQNEAPLRIVPHVEDHQVPDSPK